jgi:hypothetical protein
MPSINILNMKKPKITSEKALELNGEYAFDILHWCIEWRVNVKSHVISVCIDNVADLELKWEKIDSSVAAIYQSKFEDDFERWNLYLIFFVKECVPKVLKYKIDNDKFSSRKIVRDNFEFIAKQSQNNKIENYIREKILEVEIAEKNREKSASEEKDNFSIPTEILDIIEKYKPKQGNTQQEKDNRREALAELLKKYKR